MWHAVLKRVGWDVEAEGLFGAPPITVIVSNEAHPTLFKSLGMLGLGLGRSRGVDVSAALSSLGRGGVADLITRSCRHARRLAQGLTAAGHEAEGTCWCGVTEWQGQTAMRISVSSWATTAEDVEISLAAMLAVAGH